MESHRRPVPCKPRTWFRTSSRWRSLARRTRARRIATATAVISSSSTTPIGRSSYRDRAAAGACALRGSGLRGRGRVPRVRRDARAPGACPSDVGRADYALSGHCRALALRAHPLAEILPMTRSHRSVHRALWPILALAVALGLAAALALRPPPDVEAPQATQGPKS